MSQPLNRPEPINSLADDIVLQESLKHAVPLWIEELRAMPEREREAYIYRWGGDGARLVGTYGDALQFKTKRWQSTALAFNGLAKGLAAMAFLPDGANFPGLHWCVAPHDACPRAAAPAETPERGAA